MTDSWISNHLLIISKTSDCHFSFLLLDPAPKGTKIWVVLLITVNQYIIKPRKLMQLGDCWRFLNKITGANTKDILNENYCKFSRPVCVCFFPTLTPPHAPLQIICRLWHWHRLDWGLTQHTSFCCQVAVKKMHHMSPSSCFWRHPRTRRSTGFTVFSLWSRHHRH